ncbi:MAG: DEAD/DEAH box helicase, partial [Planctomycetota bacterium]|nr:DEAD/DEAH box helicase [Planctomycetota bacterium]
RKPRAPGAGGNDVFADVTFEDLGLRNSVMKAVRELGFEKATFIQAGIIPAVLQGRDVLGQAKTGSGKTAAFGLPLFHLATRQLPCQSIVLCPTRELCIQIARDLSNFGKYTPIRVVAVYGGQPIQTQARKLEEGPEIVVATPGRLMDLMERRIIHLNNVRFAVLDEVDRMLDIGFRDDIRKILKTIKTDHQTVFVSATISPEIENLARTYMKEDVEKIVTTAGALTVEMVEQHYLTVNRWDKKRLLLHLLTHEEPDLTVVFCRTKRMVDDLTDYLSRKKIDAHAIHGDMHQGRRNKVMERLRHGQLSVVVASDLAARGLDVDDISHVVNYDLPEDPEIYIHRIGRTARAGRNGVAWSLVTPEEGPLLTAIEKLANVEIPHMDYPDFEPSQPPDGVRQRMEADQKSKSAPAKSRYAAADLPAAPVANAPKNDPRFPGGIVPSKLPPRKMQGKVSTGRGAKAAAALPPTDPKPEE